MVPVDPQRGAKQRFPPLAKEIVLVFRCLDKCVNQVHDSCSIYQNVSLQNQKNLQRKLHASNLQKKGHIQLTTTKPYPTTRKTTRPKGIPHRQGTVRIGTLATHFHQSRSAHTRTGGVSTLVVPQTQAFFGKTFKSLI